MRRCWRSLAGALAGLVTALLNVRFKILHLLASILTMIALFSINLRIMGRPNIALLGEPTVLTPFQGLGVAALLLQARSLVGGGTRGDHAPADPVPASDYGLALRATGANPRMARAQGIATGRAICVGMALSNALVALAGALFAQTNGFADITIGTGTIVVGLAAVIVGETLLPARRLGVVVLAGVLGSILYRLAVAFALNADVPGPRGVRPQPRDRRAGRPRADPAGRPQPAPGAARPPGAGMIEIEGLEVTFGRGTALETRALAGIDLETRRGRVRDRDRLQWRRQVDAAERADRRCRARARPDRDRSARTSPAGPRPRAPG